MDRAKNGRSIVATMVLVVLFAGQASASFRSCFASCAVSCLFGGHKFLCVLKCFPRCLLGEGLSELNYCKLGCAVDQCASLAEDFNIGDVDKVESCVNECEIGKCTLLSQLAVASSALPSFEQLPPVGAPLPSKNKISD